MFITASSEAVVEPAGSYEEGGGSGAAVRQLTWDHMPTCHGVLIPNCLLGAYILTPPGCVSGWVGCRELMSSLYGNTRGAGNFFIFLNKESR